MIFSTSKQSGIFRLIVLRNTILSDIKNIQKIEQDKLIK